MDGLNTELLPNENGCSLITFETMSSTEFSNFSEQNHLNNLIIENR